MKFANLLVILFCLLPVLALADFMLLEADFNDKISETPIGTGGPDLGEPIAVQTSLSARVRETPFATKSLEIMRAVEGPTEAVIWEFVGSASVDVGHVTMSVDVVFDAIHDFTLLDVREQGSWSSAFCNIYSSVDGNFRLSDAAGYYGTIGSYTAGPEYNLQVILDCENDTYDVFINGSPVVVDRSHGKVGVGIGRVAMKVVHSTPIDAAYSVDNLLITADEYTAAEGSTFSELKAIY